MEVLVDFDKNLEDFKENLITVMHEIGVKYPDCGYGGHFLVWMLRNKREPYNSFGNGSAMRISPVGYAFDSLEETLKECEKATIPSTAYLNNFQKDHFVLPAALSTFS